MFSRNMENNTNKYPDVVQSLPKILKDTVKSIIIDSEVVAWDPEKKRILPFQILSTRKKKTESVKDVKIQVLIVAFDLLLLNGESMLGKTFRERRAKLRESLRETNGIIRFAESYDVDLSSADDSENKESDSTQDMEEVNQFLEQAVKNGTEGLMVKTLDVNASYEPSVRSLNWLKLKKDYVDGCGMLLFEHDALFLLISLSPHPTQKKQTNKTKPLVSR